MVEIEDEYYVVSSFRFLGAPDSNRTSGCLLGGGEEKRDGGERTWRLMMDWARDRDCWNAVILVNKGDIDDIFQSKEVGRGGVVLERVEGRDI